LDTNDPEEIKALSNWNRGKYKKHLTHTKKHLYVSETIENVIYNADSVRAFDEGIITEGIIDALLAKQAGFGVISPVTTKFAKRDIEQLCKLSKNWNTTYIINDNETSGEGEKGAVKTAERLFSDGQDVRLVTLPRPEGVEKIDLADYLNVPTNQRETRIDELRQLMNEAPDYIEWKISEVADLPERDRPKPTQEIFALLTNVDDKLALERYSDVMQTAELVSKKSFNDGLKDAKIDKAKKRKQQRMNILEGESPELYLKAQVQEVRKDKYGKAFEVKQNVSKIILDDMLECGRFYQTVSQEFFWFEDKENVLYPLGSEALGIKINNKYGINQSEVEYEFLMKDLLTNASVNGTSTDVYKFAFYDNKKHILYVFNNADGIYRLDGKQIKLVANGTDGVLFLKDYDWEPFEYRNVGDTDYLSELIVNPINFVDGDHVNLSKDEQRFMFMLWIYSLFFESIQPTKPILTIIGEKGSGKTTVQRVAGKMLLGDRFDVTPIAKEDDFDATISNNYVVCFDNVDGKIDWLNDRLAHTATGKMIQKRKL
jgi:DNA primase